MTVVRGALLLLLTAAFAAPRDLDVAVPPGTPLEWTKELRPPMPTGYRGCVPTGGGSGVLDGGTTALGVDFGSTNPLGVSRITTRDLPGHLPWTVPKETEGANRVPTPGGSITWEYPPAVTPLQHWWCLAPLLRGGLHPNLVSEAEIALLLVQIGEPALAAAQAADGYGFCSEAVRFLKREVTPVPGKKPEPPAMDSPIQAMFARLAAEELTSDFPWGMNPYFAQRTLSLGDAAFPAVLACAKSDHAFLRRNAVSVLAGYGKPEGLALLREYAASSKDGVVRVRAILALAQRRDREIVPLLVKGLDSGDRYVRTLSAHALGIAGQGGDVLLKKAKALAGDGEFLFTALPALARIRMNDEKHTRDLAALASAVAGRSYDESPSQPPDVPDPKNTKRMILSEFALLALAANGHEKAGAEAVAKTSWRPAAQYLAIEVLGGLGEDGCKVLLAMAENAQLEPVVRAQAMARLLVPVPNVKTAERIALDESLPPGVRGIAIAALPGYDPAAARRVSRPIAEAYVKGKYRTPVETYLVLVAVQTMGRAGEADVDLLLEVAENAVAQRRRNAAPAKRAPQRDGWWNQEIEIVIEPPLVETVVLELGRTKSRRAGEMLALLLADAGQDARAEAALGLGAVGGKAALAALADALADKDGWVRYCAYSALHTSTGRDFFADWIGGGANARDDAAAKWKELVK